MNIFLRNMPTTKLKYMSKCNKLNRSPETKIERTSKSRSKNDVKGGKRKKKLTDFSTKKKRPIASKEKMDRSPKRKLRSLVSISVGAQSSSKIKRRRRTSQMRVILTRIKKIIKSNKPNQI